jgi:hypothetical protein
MAQLIHGTTIANHIAIHAGNMADHNIATTSYVTTQINNLIDGAPGALDTLNELAAALGDNASFATGVTDSIAGKVSKAGDIITTSNAYGLVIDHTPVLGDFVDALLLRSTTSGQRAQLGFATVDADGNHHRASIRAYKGAGTLEGVFGIALRQVGGNHTQRLTLTADGNLTIDGQLTASGGNSSQWNTAYGWGNHAGRYMLEGLTLTDINTINNGGNRYDPSVNNPTNEHYAVLTYGNRSNVTGQLATHFQTGNLYSRGYNSSWSTWRRYWNDTDFTSTNISNWNTAFSWGNHASANYLVKGTQITSDASWTTATRFGSVGDISQDAGNHALSVRSEDGNDAFMSFHIGSDYAVHFGLERSTNRMHVGGWSDGRNRYQIWDSRDFTSTNVSNWNTAYGWGNHAGLYAAASHNHDGRYLLLSGGTLTGDLLSTHPLYPGYNNGGVGSQGSYYLYGDTGNSGIRTNGNFLANGDIYLGTRGVWLSSWLNQSVQTGASPTFNELYADGKYSRFGSSSNWDSGSLNGQNSTITNVHFQGHQDFWIGAGNTRWYTSVEGGHHDLLINTMQSGGSNIRGITFTASSGGASVYRLGRWQSGTSSSTSYLNLDNRLAVGIADHTYSLPSAMVYVKGSTDGADVFAVDGINGRLFTVTDSLVDSIYSVNTIAGLPVFEVFANSTVIIGKYGLSTTFSNDGSITTPGSVTTGGTITTPSHGNSSQWNTAYNKRPTAISFSGGSTKTLTLTHGDGTTIEASFNDIDTDTNTDGQTLSISGSTLTISGGNSISLPSGGISQATADGLYQPLENQRLSTGNSPTFVDIYANEWFRNNNANEGLYNQATGTHFYSSNGSGWTVTGSGGIVELVFRSNHQSTIRGYVYADTSNNIGFLNNSGNWAFRTDSSSNAQVYGYLTVGNGTSSDIYMTDTDETTRRIHCNSGRIGFLTSANGWGAYADNSGNWFAANLSGTNTGDQTDIAGNAATATNVAWTGVTGRPTALSQFSNDLGNYGGFLTALPSHNHDDRYYTETEIANFSYWRDNEARTIKTLFFTGVGGDSGNSSNHSYAIYQGGGGWSHPYPDLHIGYHTGIKLGANTGYGGIRFYDDSTMVTELFSVGNGDSHVRAANNLIVGGTISGSNFSGSHSGTSSGTNTGDQTSVSGNSGTTSQRQFDYIYTTSYLESAGAVYGTIFYDNNDREFYVDPNSSSRLRNLYVGDSGSNWSDPGGWGTQLHVSNGPHSIIRVYARTEAIETVLFSHGGGQSKVGSGTNHNFAIVRNFSDRMTFYSGYTYSEGYLQAADSLRAPIFYDSNDTGYYLDPNGTSNLRKFSEFTMAYNGMNPMSANSPYVDRYNGSVHYRNGTMGNGRVDFNTIFSNWGSGFIDTWSSPDNAPGGSSHYIGLQSLHYSEAGTNTVYGFQMACAGEADNRFFWRASWPSKRSWVEMIHSGTIGSQSVNYATTAGSANSVAWTNVSGRPTTTSAFTNDSGYITSGSNVVGLYSSGFGNGNFTWYQSPGGLSPYGGSWASFLVSNHGDGATYYNQTIIMPFWGPPQYMRNEGGTNRGPYTFWTTENLDPITTSNIGSQSVSYATTSGTAARATRANGNFYIDDNYGNTVVGVYESTRLQGVWAMGDAYKLSADGTSAANHYGIAWSHPNHGGEAANLTDHGVLIQIAGRTKTAISTSIWCIGDIIAFSDARVKANVAVIDNPLERLSKVRGVTFTRTDLEDPTKRYTGVIAQEMREALPEAVSENSNGELSVSYGNTVSLLIESIKAQQAQIEELKLEVKKLKGE